MQYLQTYGWASTKVGQEAPFTKSTVHGIGSVSKPMTAVAIMRLQEMTRLDIDDPISMHLPHAVPVSWNGITIRQALSHNGGFGRDPDPAQAGTLTPAQVDASFGLVHASQHPRYALWEFLLTDNAASDPAKVNDFHYSNIGYTVLGAIIDWITLDGTFPEHQQGYERFVWSLVARAHGPYNPNAALTAALDHPWRQGDIPNEARLYDAAGAETVPTFSGWQSAAGGWSMTIGDLARFLAAFANDEIIGWPSRGQMLADHHVGPDDYGLGFYLDDKLGLPAYWHGGVISGYRCQLTYWPTEDVGVVVMGNRDVHGVGAIADAVGELYMAGETEIVPPTDESAQSAMYQVSVNHAAGVEQLAGQYVNRYGASGAARVLARQLAGQSSLGGLLVQTAEEPGVDLERASQLFLGTLAADGHVGPYRVKSSSR